MIEKDYIMRILQQFFLFLNTLLGNLNDNNIEETRMQLKDMYVTYFEKSYQYYYNINIAELLNQFKSNEEYWKSERIEMLSELYYNDGFLSNNSSLKNDLLNKALILYDYLEEKSKSFSLERFNKRNKIIEILALK